MGWSDAARAAAEARKRKNLKMGPLRKAVSSTKANLFRATVNLESYSNPDWVKRGGWTTKDVRRGIKDFKLVINSNRQLSTELARRIAIRSKK